MAKFQELTAADPRAFRSFSELTITQMDNAFMLESILAPPDTGSRVVATLYRLVGAFQEIDDQFELPCRQSEIAEMAGMSRNTADPVLRDLASDSLIQIGRNLIRYNPVHLSGALGL